MMDTLLRRRQMMESIPYKRIEYLESTGAQYINTNIILQGDEIIEITFQYTSAQSTIIFGSRISSGGGKITIGSGSQNTQIYAALGSAANPAIARFDTNIHTVVLNTKTGKASIDGSADTNVGTFNVNDLSIFLFACNQNNSVDFKSSARIMSVKISNIAFLQPVRVNNIGYMYDKVSKKLFGNSGTGDFILGPDKV